MKKKINRHVHENGWLYEEYKFAPGVMVATKTLVGPTEEDMRKLARNATSTLWIAIDFNDEMKANRSRWRVELYGKFGRDDTYAEKMGKMKEIIKKLKIN